MWLSRRKSHHPATEAAIRKWLDRKSRRQLRTALKRPSETFIVSIEVYDNGKVDFRGYQGLGHLPLRRRLESSEEWQELALLALCALGPDLSPRRDDILRLVRQLPGPGHRLSVMPEGCIGSRRESAYQVVELFQEEFSKGA